MNKFQVHLWVADLKSLKRDYIKYREFLSEQEKENEQRFRMPELKMQFTIGRGVFRRLLNGYLGIRDNRCVNLFYGKFGKPFLLDNLNNLQFNVSHSQDLIVCGFTHHAEIGVDIEYVQHSLPIEELLSFVLSPSERVTFNSLDESAKIMAFYNAWTRKEAFVKAIGLGLSKKLTEFEVSFIPQETPKILSIDGQSAGGQWSLNSISISPNYVGAVAIEHAQPHLQILHYGSGEVIDIPPLF